MDFPTCAICGAAMVDTSKHRRWHEDLERKMKNTVADVMRELDRKVSLALLGRPH